MAKRRVKLEDAVRAVVRGQTHVAKAVPVRKRLEKVTLPALRILADLDFSAKPWRPQGQEA